MKTKFWFLLILLLLLITFVSCDASGVGETTPVAETTTVTTAPLFSSFEDFGSMKEYSDYIDQTYFDYDITHKPTREDAMKVTEGMKVAEVIALMGKAHDVWGSGQTYLVWYLEDGDVCSMPLFWPDDAPCAGPPHYLAVLEYGYIGFVGFKSSFE